MADNEEKMNGGAPEMLVFRKQEGGGIRFTAKVFDTVNTDQIADANRRFIADMMANPANYDVLESLYPWPHLRSDMPLSYELLKETIDTCNRNQLLDELEEKKPMINRKEVLDRADKCVNGDREGSYGSPEDNFARIAKMWNAYLGNTYPRKDLKPSDVAAMLALLKIARIGSGNYKDDNWIDLAGYAACGGELQCMEEDDE